jgi:UDP-glucose 4-epimerase
MGKGASVTGIGHGLWHNRKHAEFQPAACHSADVTLDTLVTYANEPDLIVHCAGSGSVSFSMAHPFQDYGRTVSSTAAVLEYIRLYSPLTKLVYPSSAAVYGLVDELPICESAPLNPASPYGVHKLMAERLCLSYAANYDVAVSMIRFFSIYGEGLRKQLLWDACGKIECGEHAFFGTGAELRDWLHVEDAARLVEVAAASASSSCPVVNGANGEAVSVREILLQLFQAYGTQLRPEFTGTARPGDPPGYHADMTMAAERLGWAPQIDLKAGIARYVDWFKSGAP